MKKIILASLVFSASRLWAFKCQAPQFEQTKTNLERILLNSSCLAEPLDQNLCRLAISGSIGALGLAYAASKLPQYFLASQLEVKHSDRASKYLGRINDHRKFSLQKVLEATEKLKNYNPARYGDSYPKTAIKSLPTLSQAIEANKKKLAKELAHIATQRAVKKAAAKALIWRTASGLGTAWLLYDIFEIAYNETKDQLKEPTVASQYKSAAGIFAFAELSDQKQCELIEADPDLGGKLDKMARALDNYMLDQLPQRVSTRCLGGDKSLNVIEFKDGSKKLIEYRFDSSGELRRYTSYDLPIKLSPQDAANFTDLARKRPNYQVSKVGNSLVLDKASLASGQQNPQTITRLERAVDEEARVLALNSLPLGELCSEQSLPSKAQSPSKPAGAP